VGLLDVFESDTVHGSPYAIQKMIKLAPRYESYIIMKKTHDQRRSHNVKNSFRIDLLIDAIHRRLTEVGLNAEYAKIVASHVVDAEASGARSHGIIRLAGIISNVQSSNRNGPGRFVHVSPTVLKYDAHGELGIVALQKSAEKAVEVTNQEYSSIIAVTGYAGTTGVLGAYTRYLAKQGIVAIAACGSEYAVAPYGGKRAILGTNPVSVSFPADHTSFSADLATAAWSYGDIKVAMNENRSIPQGVVQTIHGESSTDPYDADNGSQLPMAGHKGYALGLAIELLCGPLIGAKGGRDAVPGGDGAVLISLRSDSFRDRGEVFREADLLFDEVKSTGENVRIPGERHFDVTADFNSEIAVDLEVLRSIGIKVE
jgi:L-2-hydroxycarboxylate dehydrogenase (NAD+)